MTTEEAKRLTAAATLLPHAPQTWADLGCGSGVFTYALASLLPAGSNIICMDKSPQRIKAEHNGVSLQFVQTDFVEASFAPASLSGILMANALHYVTNHQAFVEKMKASLSINASWLLIEYDTRVASPWVPYPLSFQTLQTLFYSVGYTVVNKLGEKSSVYGRAKLYGCEIR